MPRIAPIQKEKEQTIINKEMIVVCFLYCAYIKKKRYITPSKKENKVMVAACACNTPTKTPNEAHIAI